VTTGDPWARFAEPARGYWPTPLWWWSGDRLQGGRLRWQMERLVEGGARNLVIMNLAPSGPLYGSDADDPAFMSEDWWELFDGVCRDAHELDVGIWFYDQIGFSGANLQGEIVRRHPEDTGLALERATALVEGDGEVVCPQAGRPIAAAALPVDRAGRPLGGATPVEVEGDRAAWRGDGTCRLMLFYAVERGFDYFSPRACRRLMDTVHGAFEARAARWLGSVIVGSFQDELPALPTWSTSFPKEFARIAGYELVPRLAALWEDLGAESEQVRRDFHVVRGALAEGAFFRPLHEWHERHGLLCAFDQQEGAREGEPVEAGRLYGDYLRTHRWFSAPGSDHHGDGKVHSSLAHAYGRKRTWIEAFHSSGWGGTLEETFDWLLPWVGAGANLYNPHATYYATRRGWWEWAPPATDWRQPYWRHHEHFARAVARLCSVLTWGTHACEVAVLHPTSTVQAGLGLDGPSATARAAASAYQRTVGRMQWYRPQPGVLNELARDFDVLDEATVAASAVADGCLEHHGERYRALVLPRCEVLEADTARRLVEFVDAGGTLVAVGRPPACAAGRRADPAPLTALRERFAGGAARLVAAPGDLGAALEDVPEQVRAPVPTLRRVDGDRMVVFVPAAFPRATRAQVSDDPHAAWPWLTLRYDFAPERYARELEVTVTGVHGAPELWEPFSGNRRRLSARPVADGVTVSVPFTDGPCALLVWHGADADAAANAPDPGRALPLDGAWDVEVEAALEDRWGDLDAPGAPVETWALEHRDRGAWVTAHATFGPRGEWSGPGATGWQPAVWSRSRGIRKDPVHLPTLGPSGRVPEEFLHFGRLAAGEAVRFRTTIHAERTLATHLAVGAATAKEAWLDGAPVGLRGDGYLAHGPVVVPAGHSVLELRLEAGADVDLRAHFAFVADIGGYERPEWLRAAGPVARDSVVAFSTRFELVGDAVDGVLLVGANGPCRVLVDGVEIGRHGGFDPYLEHDAPRFQRYEATSTLRSGAHDLRLELLALGRRPPAAIVDGVVRSPTGTLHVSSGAGWKAARDGAEVGLELRREQHGDPAFAHAWRRPHPLPAGAWLEPGRRTADAGGPVDVRAGVDAVPQRLRLTTPPGARGMVVPLAAGCRLRAVTVGGTALAFDAGAAITLPEGPRAPTSCELEIDPAPGLSGGAVLAGPVAFDVGPGTMRLGDWQERGLPCHSGAVRYRRRVEGIPDGPAILDLGTVRGTAEVFVNGASAGVRVCSPYVFDLTGLAAGDVEVEVEIVVCNTLAPHLDAVSPTHYVFDGQKRSGILGPVTLRVADAP
jgi:hypothetical protein